MVTSSTLHKEHHFRDKDRLAYLEEQLLQLAPEFGWALEAWAVFSNHYHFVGRSSDEGTNLGQFMGKLHGCSARHINRLDKTPGRTVWFNYRQTKLTYEKSYLARLNYVMNNPVKHGLVEVADQYPYCSAEWFRVHADPAWYGTVTSLPIDRLNIEDDF